MTEDADLETSSQDYARRFAGPVGAFLLETQTRLTLDLLRPWPAARVLDVGGGHAQLVGPLTDAGHDVTVYGSSAGCAARMAPWLEDHRASFVAGDLLRTPFPDRAFDVVVSYRLLPHVRAWRELVGELCRLARRAVLVDYPTLRSANVLSEGLFSLKRSVEGNTRPYTVFRDGEMDAAFAAAGLHPSARRRQFLFPMALHRALGLAGLSRALEGSASVLRLTGLLGSPVILRAERA